MVGRDQRAAAAERAASAARAAVPMTIVFVDTMPGAAELEIGRLGANGNRLDAAGHLVSPATPCDARTAVQAIGALENVYPGRYRFHLAPVSVPAELAR